MRNIHNINDSALMETSKKTWRGRNVILHKLYLNPLNLVGELLEFSFLPLPTLPDVLREVVRWNKPERDEFLQKMFLFDVGIIAVVVLSLVLRDRGQVLNDLNAIFSWTKTLL